MRRIRTYHEVDHSTGSGLLEQVLEQREQLRVRLSGIGRVVAVASGKGGVGKSAVTANLAATLAVAGARVGVVDADLNGPSAARMLGALGSRLGDGPEGVVPAEGAAGVRVMSMELLQVDEHTPLRWKEPGGDRYLWQSSMETSALREFLADVAWGALDFLLVDVPPGTDKVRRLLELVPSLHGAVVVATPGGVAGAAVGRSLRLLTEERVPVIGMAANMIGYLCQECGTRHALFPGDEPERLARRFRVPIWSEIPFDPRLGQAMDRGRPWVLEDPRGAVAEAFRTLGAGLQTALADAETGAGRGDREPEVP